MGYELFFEQIRATIDPAELVASGAEREVREAGLWSEWIDYLHDAIDCGGFRVG